MITEIKELPSLKLHVNILHNAVDGNVEMSIVRYNHEPLTHESLRNVFNKTYYILYDYQKEAIGVFDQWHNNFDEQIPIVMINHPWDEQEDWGLTEHEFKWIGAILISKQPYNCPTCGSRTMVRDYVTVNGAVEILHECPECGRSYVPLAKDGE